MGEEGEGVEVGKIGGAYCSLRVVEEYEVNGTPTVSALQAVIWQLAVFCRWCHSRTQNIDGLCAELYGAFCLSGALA